MRRSFPRPDGNRPARSTAGRLAIVALLAICAGVMACAGEELPNAPDPPRIRHTPPPDLEPSPDTGASPSPGVPTPTPRPSGTLPPAPRDGQLVRTGSNYLEFLDGTQDGKLLFFAFPYDSKLQPARNPAAEGSATIKIDGVQYAMGVLNDTRNGGDLFFYLFPKIGPGSHQIEITAKVKNVDYSGKFTYP